MATVQPGPAALPGRPRACHYLSSSDAGQVRPLLMAVISTAPVTVRETRRNQTGLMGVNEVFAVQ